MLGVKNWPTLLPKLLTGRAQKTLLVVLRNGLRFYVRTALDLWIIKETCLDHQYERASVPFQNGWMVLDIGAGLGDFTVNVAKTCPRTLVFAYEPFPPSYQLLQENLKLNGIANVQTFPCAIAAENGTLELRAVSAEAVEQSTAASESRASRAIQVESISLDKALADIDHCEYVKMDCEGAEYSILFSAGETTLRKIQHICLEYHDGVTAFSHRELAAFFERNNFRVSEQPNPAHRHLGLIYASNQNPMAAENPVKAEYVPARQS